MSRVMIVVAAAAIAVQVTPGTAAAQSGTGGCPAPAPAVPAYGTGGSATDNKPDDPLFAAQWGLRQIRAPQAWRRSRGAGAVVAVVDTGVDLAHPDLRDQLVPGVDLWESRPGGGPDCPGPQDEQFHGTMVAGVVAAETGNGIGIAGVAPAAKIMPVRVRPAVDSTDFSRVGTGIRWAADHGADVISLTGGAVVPLRPAPLFPEDIAEAAAYAWERGVVLVATAGNNSLPWCQYPAATDHFVCAAANDAEGRPAGYSQLPLKLGSGVALRGPGGTRRAECDSAGDVWSTTLPGAARVDACGDRGYGTDSGTTYATAHIAGVAALLAARRLENDEIVDCLRRTATNRGRYDPLTGYGTVDAAAATGCGERRDRSPRRR